VDTFPDHASGDKDGFIGGTVLAIHPSGFSVL
jgi:hypothetical protein